MTTHRGYRGNGNGNGTGGTALAPLLGDLAKQLEAMRQELPQRYASREAYEAHIRESQEDRRDLRSSIQTLAGQLQTLVQSVQTLAGKLENQMSRAEIERADAQRVLVDTWAIEKRGLEHQITELEGRFRDYIREAKGSLQRLLPWVSVAFSGCAVTLTMLGMAGAALIWIITHVH